MSNVIGLTLEEKKRLINESATLEELSVQALPNSTIEEYFFVSYSHKDYKLVYDDLLDLEENGLNIWYDRALPAGKNWEENAFKFMKPLACKGVIFYISEQSLSSEATLQEIKYAKEFGKTIIPINLPIKDHTNNQNSNIISARGMIEELENNGYKFSESDKNKYLNVFPDNMIFLPINMAADKKIEKIMANLFLPEKIVIDQDMSSGDFNEITISKVVDQNILEISETDFERAFSKVKKTLQITYNGDNVIDSMFSIDPAVFANCYYLKSIYLSDIISSIKVLAYSFYNCENLVSIYGRFDVCGAWLKSFANCKKLKNIGSENCSFLLLGKSAFAGCESLEKIKVKLDVGHNSIPSKSFYNCKDLKEIIFDCADEPTDEEMTIDSYAFKGCESLKSITLPKLLRRIGNGAFVNCKSLKEIVIPPMVKKIGIGVFAGCRDMEKIVVNKNNKVFDSRENCNAIIETSRNIIAAGCYNTIIPSSVVSIGSAAFKGCEKLVEISIPKSIITINARAFEDCINLKKISLEEGLESISNYAFANCSNLETIDIPSSVKRIDDGAFNNCSKLEELIIPEGVDSIGIIVSFCTNLETLVIPKSIQWIHPNAFFGCKNLKTIIYNGSIKNWKRLIKQWGSFQQIDASQIKETMLQEFVDTKYYDAIANRSDLTFSPPTNIVICNDGKVEVSWPIK